MAARPPTCAGSWEAPPSGACVACSALALTRAQQRQQQQPASLPRLARLVLKQLFVAQRVPQAGLLGHVPLVCGGRQRQRRQPQRGWQGWPAVAAPAVWCSAAQPLQQRLSTAPGVRTRQQHDVLHAAAARRQGLQQRQEGGVCQNDRILRRAGGTRREGGRLGRALFRCATPRGLPRTTNGQRAPTRRSTPAG